MYSYRHVNSKQNITIQYNSFFAFALQIRGKLHNAGRIRSQTVQ